MCSVAQNPLETQENSATHGQPGGESGESVPLRKPVGEAQGGGPAEAPPGWEQVQNPAIRNREVREAWVTWAASARDWKNYLTLTYRDFINQDAAVNMWRRFIQTLNHHSFGNNYTRNVHHSYFSYIMGVEKQTRDVLHFHALIDRPIDYSYIHATWSRWAGFAWIERVRDPISCADYITKYVVKGGDIFFYLAPMPVYQLHPIPKPSWWIE